MRTCKVCFVLLSDNSFYSRNDSGTEHVCKKCKLEYQKNHPREKLYHVWTSMKKRCANKNCKYFHRYGGRGITVCDEWSESYQAFRSWAMRSGYSLELQIDRIDNDKGYFPENCKWSTAKENCRNRSNTIRFKNGLTCKDVGKILGITEQAVWHRIKRLGMTPDQVVSLKKIPNGTSRSLGLLKNNLNESKMQPPQ